MYLFQSTPSLRKATPAAPFLTADKIISIHTFLAEGDITNSFSKIHMKTFQSTPSLRKATANISQITSEFLLASNKTLLF